MIEEKANQLTWKILARLKSPDLTSAFSEIQPVIVQFLEYVYAQAREDKVPEITMDVFNDPVSTLGQL